MALAEVHAAAQLQRGGMALSPDVAAALGRPDRGTTLLLHRSRHIGLPDRTTGETVRHVTAALCLAAFTILRAWIRTSRQAHLSSTSHWLATA